MLGKIGTCEMQIESFWSGDLFGNACRCLCHYNLQSILKLKDYLVNTMIIAVQGL